MNTSDIASIDVKPSGDIGMEFQAIISLLKQIAENTKKV